MAIGVFIVHVYPTKALSLPLHAPTDPDLIAKADLAYTDRADQALSLDDSFSPATDGFSKIYNRCKVSQCGVGPGLEWNLRALPMFAVFAACELMNWPAFKEIGGKEEPWSLAVAAMKEILGLSVHGEAGQEAARATTEAGLGVWLASWEEQMLPLDWQAFDRYQHGNKVNAQNRALLHACLVSGKAEGKSMSALEELLQRVEGRRGIAVYESGRFSSSTAFGGLAVPGID